MDDEYLDDSKSLLATLIQFPSVTGNGISMLQTDISDSLNFE